MKPCLLVQSLSDKHLCCRVAPRKGILVHLMGEGFHSSNKGYDSIYLISTGRMTSYGPTGDFNWQVGYDGWSLQSGFRFAWTDMEIGLVYFPIQVLVPVQWAEQTKRAEHMGDLYQSTEDGEIYQQSFKPSIASLPLQVFGKMVRPLNTTVVCSSQVHKNAPTDLLEFLQHATSQDNTPGRANSWGKQWKQTVTAPVTVSKLFTSFQTNALVTGWNSMAIVDLRDGYVLAEHSLPCQPIQKPLAADFNNDGWTDITVICPSGWGPVFLSFHVDAVGSFGCKVQIPQYLCVCN